MASEVHRVHQEMWAFLGLVNLAQMDSQASLEYQESLAHLENQGWLDHLGKEANRDQGVCQELENQEKMV